MDIWKSALKYQNGIAHVEHLLKIADQKKIFPEVSAAGLVEMTAELREVRTFAEQRK